MCLRDHVRYARGLATAAAEEKAATNAAQKTSSREYGKAIRSANARTAGVQEKSSRKTP